MPALTIDIPDELYDELEETAAELNIEASDLLMLSFNHFVQTDTIDNVIEGLDRSTMPDENLITFPELKEELDLDINFHPLAIEELESLEEEDQVELIGQLIERISQEEAAEEVDLILKEDNDDTVLLSSFDFGDITYRINDEFITIYHIALNHTLDEGFDEEEEFEPFEEEDEFGEELEFDEDED